MSSRSTPHTGITTNHSPGKRSHSLWLVVQILYFIPILEQLIPQCDQSGSVKNDRPTDSPTVQNSESFQQFQDLKADLNRLNCLHDSSHDTAVLPNDCTQDPSEETLLMSKKGGVFASPMNNDYSLGASVVNGIVILECASAVSQRGTSQYIALGSQIRNPD